LEIIITSTFSGRIWLTLGGHPVKVSCQANSPQQANRIILGIDGSSSNLG